MSGCQSYGGDPPTFQWGNWTTAALWGLQPNTGPSTPSPVGKKKFKKLWIYQVTHISNKMTTISHLPRAGSPWEKAIAYFSPAVWWVTIKSCLPQLALPFHCISIKTKDNILHLTQEHASGGFSYLKKVSNEVPLEGHCVLGSRTV